MVKKGRELFKSMEKDFSVTPKLEHYGCMVDLYGRAGELPEAYNLIQTMPKKSDSVVWGTSLGACSFYNNVELVEIAAEHIYKLEPWNPPKADQYRGLKHFPDSCSLKEARLEL